MTQQIGERGPVQIAKKISRQLDKLIKVMGNKTPAAAITTTTTTTT